MSIFSCCCKQSDADIQMAIAIYQRCGLGPFGNVIGFANLPTGPLAPGGDGSNGTGQFTDVARDPLYLVLTAKLTWADGTTFTETFTYDPNFCDMTITATGPAVAQFAPFNNQNVPPGYPNIIPQAGPNITQNGNPIPSPAFPTPAAIPGPPGIYYDGINNKGPLVTNQALTLTWTADTWHENNPDGSLKATHYGYTLTWMLSQPFSWSQYAACASGWLNGITLQDGSLNPGKTYPFTWSGYDFAAKLRYFCEFPPKNTDPNYTNVLAVRADRNASGGYVFGPPAAAINSAWGSWAGNSFSDNGGNQIVSLPCGAQIAFVPLHADLNIDFLIPRYPLAAHGMPLTMTPPNPPGVTEPLLPTGGIPGAPALSGRYIFSCKTSVRAKVDMNATVTALIYNPGPDTIIQGPIKGGTGVTPFPSGGGEHIITPDQIGGVGALMALYGIESICTTTDIPDSMWAATQYTPTTQGKAIFLGRNQSQKFYATTFDSRGNWMRNLGGIWSVGETGAGFGAVTPSCLVPSPDGLSAVFTAPNAPGQAFLVIAIPGLDFKEGIVVVIQ